MWIVISNRLVDVDSRGRAHSRICVGAGGGPHTTRATPLGGGGPLISAAFGLTEPNAGSDAGGSQTKAELKNGQWVINGSKIFITHGHVCQWMVVLCVTHPDERKRHRRQSMILVESDRKGVEANKLRGKMGIRASETTEISFSDARVPCENLVGEEQNGFYQLMHFFDATRTIWWLRRGWDWLREPWIRSLFTLTARKRETNPCCEDQRVQFHLAEMAAWNHCLRRSEAKNRHS